MARRCWLVQAGERAGRARLFESSGTVALGVNDGGVGDLAGLDAATVQQQLERDGRDTDSSSVASSLLNFRDHVRPGDVVVTVDRPARQLLVGEVIGDYEHRVGPTGAEHVRAVEWYGRYGLDDRSILSAGLAAATQLDKSVHELTPANAWMSFVAAMRERPPLAAVVRVASASATQSSAASRPRRATASRAAAPVKAKPQPPVFRRCPGCQMQKSPAQFRAGSENCVDCRERLGED
jgi:hypothetical protein